MLYIDLWELYIYCVILMRLILIFVGVLEDSDVYNGENCGVVFFFGFSIGMIFSFCSLWLFFF